MFSKDVKVAFDEAIKSLNEGNWNACVVMCRRALEEAMDNLDAAGKDLFKKIDDLASKGCAHPAMGLQVEGGKTGV